MWLKPDAPNISPLCAVLSVSENLHWDFLLVSTARTTFVELKNSGVDTINNFVYGTTTHFSAFGSGSVQLDSDKDGVGDNADTNDNNYGPIPSINVPNTKTQIGWLSRSRLCVASPTR